MQLPKAVLTAITLLNQAGYEAYVVGGAVRSALLHQEIHDFDITTSALPSETIAVFHDYKVIETGLKHGTVTIHIDHFPLEITTYRTEKNYSDHRHPDSVSFSRSLREDCQRRDFTMNALCYHPKEGIIDFFAGQSDIKHHIIRCVGNPDQRFEEDALRILRAIRFSAQLGFQVEEETARAIFSHQSDLSYVAIERINDEFTRCMTAPYFFTVLKPYQYLFAHFFSPFVQYDEAVMNVLGKDMQESSSDPVVRMALLLSPLHDLKRAKQTLLSMRYPSTFIHDVLNLLMVKDHVVTDRISLRHLCHDLSVPFAQYVSFVSVYHPDTDCDALTQLYAGMVEDGDCYSLKQLAVHGNDLSQLGYRGKEISSTLQKCLELVMDEKVDNTRNALLAYIKRPD